MRMASAEDRDATRAMRRQLSSHIATTIDRARADRRDNADEIAKALEGTLNHLNDLLNGVDERTRIAVITTLTAEVQMLSYHFIAEVVGRLVRPEFAAAICRDDRLEVERLKCVLLTLIVNPRP